MGDTPTPCEYAIERHKNCSVWRNLWTGLLFAFGVAVVLFAGAAVLLFVRETWLPGAVSILATLAGGAGIKWVVNRRKEAVEEEEKAYQNVLNQCRETKEADAIRKKHKILGKF
jgi:MFS superfamily sulfate permease-like transporter